MIAVPAVWLRDNCRCAACRDPRSGQKRFRLADLPADVAVERVEWAGEGAARTATVVFAPDGHRSVYPASWLEGPPPPDGDGRRDESTKRLWVAADLPGPPTASWGAYCAGGDVRRRVLEAVQQVGFALLRGTPTAPGTVLEVAGTFGFVRETNYGRLFDVRVEADPTNLAFTGLAIAPHTDNPYRDPVPTLQLLHCLTNAVEGGESGLLDGFRAFADLRASDPDAYGVLRRTPLPFAWTDGHAFLAAERPAVETDPAGRIAAVRWNDRSLGTLRLPVAELGPVYAALRRFARLVAEPSRLLSLRLDAGDCLIMDNTRVLHARTAFAESAAGHRHLQGCYADLDGLDSTVTRLRREAEGGV
ncbi:DUF971 domain-containing protein, partial [Acidimicrobiaceae bacterium USS-CC1]|nr:DUF971 domain-containing protein [Acidiferrimicrobium australe]